jgi:hypothetical protein
MDTVYAMEALPVNRVKIIGSFAKNKKKSASSSEDALFFL